MHTWRFTPRVMQYVVSCFVEYLYVVSTPPYYLYWWLPAECTQLKKCFNTNKKNVFDVSVCNFVAAVECTAPPPGGLGVSFFVARAHINRWAPIIDSWYHRAGTAVVLYEYLAVTTLVATQQTTAVQLCRNCTSCYGYRCIFCIFC